MAKVAARLTRLRSQTRFSIGGHPRALAQPSVAPSGLGRGDHLGDAAVGVASEQRPDVLPHPRSANLASDAIRILRCRELKDQDQVRLIDLRDTRGERSCIDHELHPASGRFDGCIRQWFTQTKVVDNDVQPLDAIAYGVRVLRGSFRDTRAAERVAVR
jgi:hypothetical protein